MADFISCGICLSDIPKDKIKRAENGKCYLNIQVAQRREVDHYGNTHTIYISQTKEEREAKENKTYIGQGKAYNPQPAAPSVESIEQMPPADNWDDLPY